MRRIGKRYWPIVLVLSFALLFALGVVGNAVRFPLGLGLLRVMFLAVEQFWTKLRV